MSTASRYFQKSDGEYVKHQLFQDRFGFLNEHLDRATNDLPTATTILSMRGMLETTAATTREMRMLYAEAWVDAT